jgi:formate hydrogenlyase subunit 4
MAHSGGAFLAWMVLLFAAPIIPGVAAKTTAFLTGRRGAPMWQPYFDIWKLLRRGNVYSITSTWVLRFAPVLLVVTTITATLFLPLAGDRAILSFSGDAIAFAYLLALGRFGLILGALDTGSSFEGMGASREATFASLVEPSLFVSLAALGVASHELSLSGMLGDQLWSRWSVIAPTMLLLAGSVFVLMLAECARVPVDDPTTHLELTMVHEVMILDHSGPDLALIQYANAVKLAAFTSIIAALLLPNATRMGAFAPLWLLLAMLASGVSIGIVESSVARLRLPKVPLFIASGGALAFLGLILVLQ